MRNGIVPNLNPSWGGAYQYRSYDALHFFGPSDHHTDELLESHVVKLRMLADMRNRGILDRPPSVSWTKPFAPTSALPRPRAADSSPLRW